MQTWFLRYRFDNVQQALAHLRSGDGRQLLFYPGASQATAGDKALVEVAVGGSQTCTLPGSVISAERGNQRGVWLELAAVDVRNELTQAAERARRTAPRLATELLVRATRARTSTSAVARLVDVSTGGARLAGVNPMWIAGEELTIAPLASPGDARGTVVWCTRGDLALKFDRTDSSTRVAVARMLVDVNGAWEKATHVQHPAFCRCVAGAAALEPTMPRVNRRQQLA